MNCKCCGIEKSLVEMFENQCPSCYEDPDKMSLLETLGYIHVILFLLVIIWL